MGKSHYIKRLSEELQANSLDSFETSVHLTIPLHGPVVTPNSVLDLFEEHFQSQPYGCIYHIDIAPNVCV